MGYDKGRGDKGETANVETAVVHGQGRGWNCRNTLKDGASCWMPRAACARWYLFGLHGERAHLPSQVHVAQVLGAVAIDAVGIVARADEHGAEQRAEVEAVALLVLDHRGRGVQVRGLAVAGWSALPARRLPPSSPRARAHAGWTPAGLLTFVG